MAKYDDVLSDLLTDFELDEKVKPEIRRIVKKVISAEISRLDLMRAHGVRDEIVNIINEEAEKIVKRQQQ